MDNLPGFAWIKDLEGRYTYANALVQELQPHRGIRVGRTDSEAWPPEISTVLCANDKIVIDTGKSLQTVEPYLREGELREALVSKFPIFDSSGAVESVGGVGIDITERVKAERASSELAAIVEGSNDAIIGKTLDGVITSWNKSAERIYGYLASEAIGRPIAILAPPELQDELRKILERIKRGESIEHLETTRLRKDGSQVSVSLTISPIKNNTGEITGASGIARDITEQKRAEQALRESEERFRTQYKSMPMPLFMWRAVNDDFVLLGGNDAAVAFTEAHLHTIVGRTASELYADMPQILEDFARCFATETLISRELPYLMRSSGGQKELIATYAFIPPDLVTVHVFDVTKHKQAEEALNAANRQLRSLSRRYIQVQENQRKHLARELHDQIGQALTAAKISIRSVKRLRKRETMARQLDKATAIIDQILLEVRQIALNLRPSALDDLGLAAALRLILDDYAKRGGWQARFFEEENMGRADAEVETICFRMALEALTNILRHAQAQKVSMKLRKKGDSLHLSVYDDGVGFDVAKTEASTERDRLGLIGMRERASEVGGKVQYKSVPGEGTEVHIFLPFHPT